MTTAGESPVEAYLDGLLVALSGSPAREVRRLLSEAESHLRDAVDEGVAAGMAEVEAERAAVARFGPAVDLAAAERSRRRPSPAALGRQFLSSVVLLGGIGAVAVGISGMVAGALQAVAGTQFLVNVPGSVLTASNCTRWLSIHPGAATCRQAAMTDWAAETVFYRIALGLLGGLALLAWRALRRRRSVAGRWATLPMPVIDTVAVTLFGLSGIWLLGLGIDAVVVSSGHGAGQWLSAAPVATVAAAAFGVRLWHDLRQEPVSRSA